MLLDLRYAARALRRRPLISLVAILTLALGIGGATAVFTVVDSVILRPLPFPQPDRLVRIWEVTPDGTRFSASEPNYLDLRAQLRSVSAIAAYSDLGGTAVLGGSAAPERIELVRTSAALFDVIGVHPQLGHAFGADDDLPGAAARVMLSDALWRRRFGADPAIVGATIVLDDRSYVVAGIMPPGFTFPRVTDVWIPLGPSAAAERDNKELALVARLDAVASAESLRGELGAIARGISDAHPAANGGWTFDAEPFDRWIVGPTFREATWVLSGAVGLLLLLACANVANLLVANASSRRVEMRVRGALGAARGRLVQLLFTESALLALLGTVGGIFVAAWTVEIIRLLGSGHVPRLDQLRIDGSVLAFGCLAGAISCVLFGLAPALQATRIDLRAGIDEGLRYTAGGRRVRHALVIVEVALALVLLVGAGLLVNSFVRLTRVDPGFSIEHVLAVPIDLPSSRYGDDRAARFYADAIARIAALPGVQAAGASSTNPFRQFGFANTVTPEDRAADAPPTGLMQAGWRSVTPGYFEAVGIPLLEGRRFDETDRAGGERVIVIGETLARRLWPGSSAVGKRIFWGGTTGRTRTVVGVVGDIRDVTLAADAPPMVFLPHAQIDLPSMTVLVRTAPGIEGIGTSIREVIAQMDPMLPAPAVLNVAASRAAASAGPRFEMTLVGSFAGIALLLAVTGVYAMLAFAVAERRRELAVRLALGADATAIARMILRDGLLLALAGVAAGTAGAFGVTRLLANLLFNVTPTDPLTFGVAVTTLLAVAAFACYLPARHAARLDPAAVLRD